jgi:hypothetical protein
VIGITLDSNIYISGLIFGGKPLRILEMGLDGRADIAISEEILRETLGIMRHKFKLPNASPKRGSISRRRHGV